MILESKPLDHIVPEYSLTGDLLSYRSCEMQYRYYNGSSLPPSRPVQLWYGEFIHGVLEESFRLWREYQFTFPWPYREIAENENPDAPPEGLAANDLRRLAWPIELSLIQQNKRARSRIARRSAYRRAHAAINILGPRLFELISSAEEKLIGTRDMPASSGRPLRAARYVLTGVIDVVTNIELDAVGVENPIAHTVRDACPGLRGTFEVIVDYKSSHRPPINDRRHWLPGEWQVKTYAWLRQRQPESPRVAAGVLLYLNELSPSANDVERIRREVAAGTTDVLPRRGSRDARELQLTRAGTRVDLSEEFRLRRAIRVIPIDNTTLDAATREFDEIVGQIESRIAREDETGSISATWPPTCEEYRTCVACDFKAFCPSPARRGNAVNIAEEDEPDEI